MMTLSRRDLAALLPALAVRATAQQTPASAVLPGLGPFFLGADDPDGLAVLFAKAQVFDFPQLHLPPALFIFKVGPGLLAVA